MPDPYISEVKFLGGGDEDFIEIAVDEGTDVSNIEFIIYNPDGTIRSVNELGEVDSTTAGRDVYAIDSTESDTFNGVHKNGAVALVVDGVVLQFISFEAEVEATEGAADGMTSTQLGATGSGESFESTDDGQSYQISTDPTAGTIPCFLSGTRILTPRGYRRVENLKPGDFVETTDEGPRRVQWVGERTLNHIESATSKYRPIRVPAHAFGAFGPDRETFVSSNHLLMINTPECEKLFGKSEVFVPAKFLLGMLGISHCPVALPIRFYHVLLGEHAVIIANDMKTESLFPGDVIKHQFSEPLPVLKGKRFKRARRVLKKREVMQLVKMLPKSWPENTSQIKLRAAG